MYTAMIWADRNAKNPYLPKLTFELRRRAPSVNRVAITHFIGTIYLVIVYYNIEFN
jgi:hypothetical protein